MADVNEMITLGVGTPSDIAHLITFGLSLGGQVIVTAYVRDFLIATFTPLYLTATYEAT